MTGLRFHRRAADLDHRAPTTQWQRERKRGPILPMGAPIPGERRPSLLQRMFGR